MLRDVKVDKHDPTDLYEQVAAEIRRAIADGEAKPGERLPPAKDLAAILGVNTNTVLRSFETASRRRTTGVPARPRHLGRGDTRTRRRRPASKELVDFARHQGYRLDELVEIIEDVA